MTRAIVEFYRTLVAGDRSHPSKPPDPPTSIAKNSRFSRLLVSYSQKQFTGAIEIASPNGQKWNIHYRLGRTIWASGGYHPLRRWRRSLHQFDAAIDFQTLEGTDRTCPRTPLEYQLLAIAIEQKRLTRQQARNIIDRVVRDAIFDIIQEEAKHALQYRLHSKDTVGHISILLNSEFVLWQVIQDWQAWCRADLAAYSPNYAPKLRQSERFARVLSPASYRQMENLMSGRHSVRDLAVRLERDLIAFTQSLVPYIRQGAIELIEIPDEPMEWIVSPHS
ncbi:MAG TPA: hypothetical protein IGS17_03405 [Oscillatoriales cyanobacterium M59_W2019_021]|nr:MAG: hypothetical protein D6728_10820 [Cyanobacteria bacterium J055]HIK49960.1 hypothetical protein [Oscillatoriales cyanobacterium M59_W2019_021]